MGATAILTLLLPYVPDLLNFLSTQLERVLVQQSPTIPPKTNEQNVRDVVRLIVDGLDEAHKDWTSTDKSKYALDAIRANLQTTYNFTLSDSEINLLIELYITRKRADGRK